MADPDKKVEIWTRRFLKKGGSYKVDPFEKYINYLDKECQKPTRESIRMNCTIHIVETLIDDLQATLATNCLDASKTEGGWVVGKPSDGFFSKIQGKSTDFTALPQYLKHNCTLAYKAKKKTINNKGKVRVIDELVIELRFIDDNTIPIKDYAFNVHVQISRNKKACRSEAGFFSRINVKYKNFLEFQNDKALLNVNSKNVGESLFEFGTMQCNNREEKVTLKKSIIEGKKVQRSLLHYALPKQKEAAQLIAVLQTIFGKRTPVPVVGEASNEETGEGLHLG